MGRTILLERRQSESVGRRNSRTTFLRSDWPRPFARREVERVGYVPWLPCSPDLRCLDFFFGVTLKGGPQKISSEFDGNLVVGLLTAAGNVRLIPDIFANEHLSLRHH
ncbi:hypothetical protein TNCV_3339111 [Trichonephila clavipes]|nr:hypothetical protein TNCV_3339111 [Trichonephila clavipes]